MPVELQIEIRQKTKTIERRCFRKITLWLATRLLPGPEATLGINLVDSPTIARINATFLNHTGPTDVITFDYSEKPRTARPGTRLASSKNRICGEIFICIDEASKQAKRFRTTWQEEMMRYVIHGILHLKGYDDAGSSARREMKMEEDKWVQEVCSRFNVAALQAKTSIQHTTSS